MPFAEHFRSDCHTNHLDKAAHGLRLFKFCHMHNLLRIGYVDALAVEHVVKLLLSLVKHGPIVVGFDPYAHHKVYAAVGQSFHSHKRLVGIGRLKYARVGGKECEHLWRTASMSCP